MAGTDESTSLPPPQQQQQQQQQQQAAATAVPATAAPGASPTATASVTAPVPAPAPATATSPVAASTTPTPAPVPTASASPSLSDALVARLLEFFGEASNGTLAVCFAGLLLVVVVLFGRIGFVLVGVVTGFFLHALWPDTLPLLPHGSSGPSRRRGARHWEESGYDTAKRILDWRTERASDVAAAAAATNAAASGVTNGATSGAATTGEEWLRDGAHDRVLDAAVADKSPDFSRLPPQTAAALASLTDAVIRDYVSWWYSPILPDEKSFVAASRDVYISFLLAISTRISRKRPADVLLDFLTNVSSLMIAFLSELAMAQSSASTTSMSTAEAVDEYLASNPDGGLVSIVDRSAQERKFHAEVEDLLKQFLEPHVYSCRPAYIFLREILVGVVLNMTLESCSRPETINGWIVYLLEETRLASSHVDAAVDGAGNHIDVAIGDYFPASSAGAAANRGPEPSAPNGSTDQKLSKAEEAMARAIQEAAKMNELIAEETRRRASAKDNAESSTSDSSSAGPLATPDESEAASSDLYHPIKSEETVETPETETPVASLTEQTPTSNRRTPNFTSFDQFIPDRTPTALQPSDSSFKASSPVDKNELPSLHDASVSLLDDAAPGGKGTYQSRSQIEYIIQIEPASSLHPGYMIARKYVDFENLHEVLRRISVVAGVAPFQSQHSSLPAWKNRSKEKIRNDLERYLQDALSHRQLADSEGMKRFLERNHSFGRPESTPTNKGGLPAAFGTMGKGMLDALASAPKGVGGVLGNVSGLGQKKDGSRSSASIVTPKEPRTGLPARSSSNKSLGPEPIRADDGPEDARSFFRSVPFQQPHVPSAAAERSSGDVAGMSRSHMSSTASLNHGSNAASSLASSFVDTPQQSSVAELDDLQLPPLPTNIPDDYGSTADRTTTTSPTRRSRDSAAGSAGTLAPSIAAQPLDNGRSKPCGTSRLTQKETQAAVDLCFAVVNELYNLSSAWNIRRTLLMAAKNFINLETFQSLIQDTLIDGNTSDAAVAAYVRRLEETAVPTPKQLRAWPSPPTEDEKDLLRVKARRLLIERGLPPALTGVMGNAASREALGKVFDCLQMEHVARGLVAGVMIQALKVVSQ